MKLAIIISTLLLAGCYAKPMESRQTDNVDVAVSKLFVHDGCTVYRFYDGGQRYFVKCEGAGVASTQWEQSCGKSCRELVEIHTAGQQ